ncbi:MAG: MmgE/PrpD family protein [Microbacterium sp.]|nr:MAG: MmgE/PrpD family protein [Microbacterium sp.]
MTRDDTTAASRRLAEWAAAARFDEVPQHHDAILNAWVDSAAVAISGFDTDEFAPVRRFATDAGIDGPGRSQLWGDGSTTSAASAALLNGTACHVMDYDDVHTRIHGHPSTVLFPALLAVAQEVDAPPERFLSGYVAGLGVMTGVSVMFGPDHYTRGWHSTATCGAVGAAAGIAAMLEFDVDGLQQAMAAAASMVGGLRANFGTTMKPLHAGLAARAGVEAVLLVRAGATARAGALELPLGAVSVFGDGSWPGDLDDPAAAVIEAAERAPEQLGLKLYPSCLGTHYAIDAALEVRERLAGERVERITVRIPRGARTALLYDDPTSGLESKFSLPFAVAVALAHGLPGPDRFTDEGAADPRVRALMTRIVVEEDPSGGDAAASMGLRYAEIAANGAEGRTATARVAHPRGSAANPASAADVDAKFRECARRLPDGHARKLLRRLRVTRDLTTLRDLFPLV